MSFFPIDTFQEFVSTMPNMVFGRGGSTRGARGDQAPYLVKINGYPPKPPSIFETKELGRREEEEEKGRKKKRREISPLLIWLLDSPLVFGTRWNLHSVLKRDFGTGYFTQ